MSMMAYHVLKVMAIMLHAAACRTLPWAILNSCKELLYSHDEVSIMALIVQLTLA